MKFQIGEEYNFNYELLHDVVKIEDAVKASLTEEQEKNLRNRLTTNAHYYEEGFKEKTAIAKKIAALVKRYDATVAKRKAKNIRKVSQKEKDLLSEIKANQEIMYPKHRAFTTNAAAENLFIRFFDPKGMSEGDAIRALYGGKVYTRKGNVVHKWYMLNPANINRKYTEGLENFLHICTK